MLAGGYLSVNLSEISGFCLTEKSWQVLRSEKQIRLKKDSVSTTVRKIKTNDFKKKNQEDLSPVLLPLWEKLRSLRLKIAKEHSLPPYCIFHDSTLKELVVLQPQDKTELLSIHGIVESKAERYGDMFLKALTAWRFEETSESENR